MLHSSIINFCAVLFDTIRRVQPQADICRAVDGGYITREEAEICLAAQPGHTLEGAEKLRLVAMLTGQNVDELDEAMDAVLRFMDEAERGEHAEESYRAPDVPDVVTAALERFEAAERASELVPVADPTLN